MVEMDRGLACISSLKDVDGRVDEAIGIVAGQLTALVGWKDSMVCACVSKAWNAAFSGDDIWKKRCTSLCEEGGLIQIRMEEKCSSSLDYKTLWTRNLWPSRSKWSKSEGDDGEADNHFNISVCVRFRNEPAGIKRSGKVLLPLHQVLRCQGKENVKDFLEKVRDETHEEGDASMSGIAEKIAASLSDDAELSSELLTTLLDAERLASFVSEEEKALMWLQAGEEKKKKKKRMEKKANFLFHFQGWVGGYELEEDDERSQRRKRNGMRASEASRRAAQKAKDLHHMRHRPGNLEGEEEEEEENLSQGRRSASAVLAVKKNNVVMLVPGSGVRTFPCFHRVLSCEYSQKEAYEQLAYGSVIDTLNGSNTCLMCYGQTGSGKTYTIFGPDGALESALNAAEGGWELGNSVGIAPRAVKDILELCESNNSKLVDNPAAVSITASMQYIQLYNGQVTDLLTGDSVKLCPNGKEFLMHGAAEVELTTLSEAYSLLRVGEERKHFASTAMNVRSSRAHTMLILGIEQTNSDKVIRSQLCLVDLAGNEQLKQSKVTGQRKAEAIGINLGLLSLKKVIKNLSENRTHVPYYESKLTMILKAALGGNSKTTAIITGSGSYEHAEHTLNALRFGEQISLATNKTRSAATSASTALSTMDRLLLDCKESLAAIESNSSKQQVVINRKEKLRKKIQDVQLKRDKLAAALALKA